VSAEVLLTPLKRNQSMMMSRRRSRKRKRKRKEKKETKTVARPLSQH
jgi:hypothetical protein